MLDKQKSLFSIAVAAGVFFSTNAYAVLPQAGMWTFADEWNGQPGRGFQVENQGANRTVITYFDYREDGTSRFTQAGGSIQDGTLLKAPLIEYAGGRGISSDGHGSASQSKNWGDIIVVFESENSAMMTLPGQEPKKIIRPTFENLAARLNNLFSVQSLGTVGSVTIDYRLSSSWYMSFENGSLNIREYFNNSTQCTYKGDLSLVGAGFNSSGDLNCDAESTYSQYKKFKIENLKVNEHGVMTARMLWVSLFMGTEVIDERVVTGLCEAGEDVISVGPRICRPETLGMGK